jgi:hypothetical protein
VVDSYPVGGGVFLVEAMALGLPVLSFDHDYVLTYSNDACSGAREILGDSALILERGDFKALADAVSKLVHDPEYRRRTGEACRQHVFRTRSNPSRMVQSCVEIYELVYADRQLQAAASTSTRPGPPEPQAVFLHERTTALDRRDAALTRREAELERRDAALTRREAELVRRETPQPRQRIGRATRRAWAKLRSVTAAGASRD